jgi:hypothetical protein
MEVFMNRLSAFAGTLTLSLSLVAMGCQGGGTDPGSPEKRKEAAEKMGEGMKQMQEKMRQKKGSAAPGGAADDDDKDKGKDKSGDKE